MTLLGMKTSIYNVETRIGIDGKPYIMEVSPRGGGNRLAEMVRFATGVDLITNAVRAAVGDSVTDVEQKPYNGHWAELVLHTQKDGRFVMLDIDKDFYSEYVRQVDLWVKEGDYVSSFKGANDAIGTLVLNFGSDIQLEKALVIYNNYLQIKIN